MSSPSSFPSSWLLLGTLLFTLIVIQVEAYALSAPTHYHRFRQNVCHLYSAADNLLDWIDQARETKQAIPLWGVHDALSAKIMHSVSNSVPNVYNSKNLCPTDDSSEDKSQSSKACAHSGLFVSGFGVSASRLGVPDAGIIARPDVVDTTNNILLSLSTPSTTFDADELGNGYGTPVVVVDGDTGFGGTANVRRTIHSLAALGAAGITIEDQIFPKRCTYVAGSSVQVVSRDEAKQRVETAIQAKKEAWEQRGQKLLIVGRTDCRNGDFSDGAREALERCLLFQQAGADIVYAESLHTADEYVWLRHKINDPSLPMMIAQVQQNVASLPSTTQKRRQQAPWTINEIGEMDYELALFGVTALQATVAALQSTARHVMHTGGVVIASSAVPAAPEEQEGTASPPPPALASLEEVKSVVGFPELDAFEADFGCT